MWRLILVALGLPGAAMADPRCARFGQPSYSAMRATVVETAPPVTTRVFLSGPSLRLETPAPRDGRMVTLITPGLSAIFLTTASPPVAMRMPAPLSTAMPAVTRRERDIPSRAGITLITEWRTADGQWLEVARSLCRRDGVLLEARHLQPREGGAVIVETRQSDIRVAALDGALFRLPDGFLLMEPPPLARAGLR